MTRRVALCFLLFTGIALGLTLEPDSGTAASLGAPDVTGSTVGANYAKPLPRITTVSEVVRVTVVAFTFALLLQLLAQVSILLRTSDHDGAARSLLWARVPARRGPPAPALG